MGLKVPTVDNFLGFCELKTGVLIVGGITLVSFLFFLFSPNNFLPDLVRVFVDCLHSWY